MANFLEKWSTKKATKPTPGAKNVVDVFRGRVAEQKAYLEEYERDTSGFSKWRSTWFQKVPGGFGVTVGRDSVDAGQGLSYVVVSSTSDVAEFLDDLAYHAENDVGFQQALEQNRLRRVGFLNAAKSAGAKSMDKPSKPAATASSATPKTIVSRAKPASKTKASTAPQPGAARRGRKPKSDASA